MKISIEAKQTYLFQREAGDITPSLCEMIKEEMVAELAGTAQSLFEEELFHWHIDAENRTITGTIEVELDTEDDEEEPGIPD
jgi:hypothetical protein